ncbi:MAG: hypothetical protein U0L74_08185 [Paludibacteraceae bacterium]|nr:hypothetical protein [Paludibacteraceae bacterium]
MDLNLFNKLTEKRRVLAAQLLDPAVAGFWNMVVDKYSEQAHFIFELLQNADDAGASQARLYLNEDSVSFVHNGTEPFSVSDADLEGKIPNGHINAITSIGASSKQEGNLIGKFGIGFKSVFQYTLKPHIEDDNISFQIENYIVPALADRKNDGRRFCGETLFVLPFYKDGSFHEIEQKLLKLENPLLFLPKLKMVSVFVNDKLFKVFRKECSGQCNENTFCYSSVAIITEQDDNRLTKYSHMFDRTTDPHKGLKISVAFPCDKNGCPIVSDEERKTYCYFPTYEKSGLSFDINAPFLLTENRENIKREEEWNLKNINDLAELACDALLFLCSEKKVINDNIFDIVPTDKSLFFNKKNEPTSLFHTFYTKLADFLKRADVFWAEGEYISSRQTRFAAEKNIEKLFDSGRLSNLFCDKAEENRRWAFSTLHIGNNSEENVKIRRKLDYIEEHCLVSSHVSALHIAENITDTFIESQEINWLKRLYTFFGSHKGVYNSASSTLRAKPFVLCEDGKARRAFADNEPEPCIYLSSDDNSSCICQELLADDKCRFFFENQIGLKKPGLLSIITKRIDSYRNGYVNISDKETIYSDNNLFVRYIAENPYDTEQRSAFLNMFKGLAFIPSATPDGNFCFATPEEAYFDTKTLREYFGTNREARFLEHALLADGFEPAKRDDAYRFFMYLGVSFYPKIKKTEREPSPEIHQKLRLKPKSLRQYDNGNQSISDVEIHGFDHFLSNISKESSAAFFSMLKQNIREHGSYIFDRSIEGTFRYVEKSKQTFTEEKIINTTAKQSLFGTKWLARKDGEFCKPSEIANFEELMDCYDLSSSEIFLYLGIKHDPILNKLTEKQRESIKLIEEFEKAGISIDDLRLFLKKNIKKC